ncbi:hypothetical protein ACFLQU_01665 [Verrucomicrobiota bacterium]
MLVAGSHLHAADLDYALKLTTLGSRAPDDELLYPDTSSAIGLARLRFNLTGSYGDLINAELAYEHSARVTTDDAGKLTGAGILPSDAEAPYRLRQWDWEIDGDDEQYSWRHEIDRAFLALHPPWGEVTVGRQAIGLGRGALFGAMDIFAPFSPTEVDREWRRGVDAARTEYRFSDTASAEVMGAFGENSDESAVLGRVRGYWGDVDAEFVAGRRGEDDMYGGSLSAAVGDSEVHAEAALFRTPEDQPDGGLFGESNLVGKAVLGASYTFDVGDGLTVLGEYHYSGFGVENIEDVSARFTNETFVARYLRGDTQILGRHALALQVTYPFVETWTGTMLVMQSPDDGSGLAAPSLLWDAAESTSVALSVLVPWGDEPVDGRFQSEYGGTPLSLTLQVSLYY